MLQIIRDACNIVAEPGQPGPSRLAKLIGVSRQSLYMWQRVPAERVIAVENATGGRIQRGHIRPDLYPPTPQDGVAAVDTVNNIEDGHALQAARGESAR